MNDTIYCRWELSQLNTDGTLLSEPKLLKKGETSIGRAKNNTVQSLSSMSSRHQCIITLEEDGFVLLRDLGSLNGTFIGSDRVDPERAVTLNHNDVVGFGVDPTDDRDNVQSAIFRLRRIILDKEEIISYNKNCVVPLQSQKKSAPQSIIVIDDEEELNVHVENTSTNLNVEPIPSTSRGITGNPNIKVVETIEIKDTESEGIEVILDEHKNYKWSDSISKNNKETSGEHVTECHEREIGKINLFKPFNNVDIIDISKSGQSKCISNDEENLKKVPCEVLSEDEIKDLSGKDLNFQTSVVGKPLLFETSCINNAIHLKTNEIKSNVENVTSNNMSKDLLNKEINNLSSPINLPSNLSTKATIQKSDDDKNPCINLNSNLNKLELSHENNDAFKQPCDFLKSSKTNVHSIIEDGPQKENGIESDKLIQKLDLTGSLKVNAKAEEILIVTHEENLSPKDSKISEVDEVIKGIYERRLSAKSENSEKETEIPTGKKTNETTVVSECFTIDDDGIICIDDETELPCSQMFEKSEIQNEENVQALDEDCNYDEDELSDTDSTDEWFQRLSQSCPMENDSDMEYLDIDRTDNNQQKNDNKTDIDDKYFEEVDKDVVDSKDITEIPENNIQDNFKSLVQKNILSDDNKEGGDEKVTDIILEEDFSEPLFRKCTSGSKRKLPALSDDEDGIDALVTETVKGTLNKLKVNDNKETSTKYKKSKKIKLSTKSGNSKVDKQNVDKGIKPLNESAANKNVENVEVTFSNKSVNNRKRSLDADGSERSCQGTDILDVNLFGEKEAFSKKFKGTNTARKHTSGKVFYKTKHNKKDLKGNTSEIGAKDNDNSKEIWQDVVYAMVTKIDEIEKATEKANCQSPDLPTGHLISDITDTSINQANHKEQKNLELNNPSIEPLNNAVNLRPEILSKQNINDENNIVLHKSSKSSTKSQKGIQSTSKLNAANKKMSVSHKKKSIEIIDAKALPIRRKSSAVGEEKSIMDNKEDISTTSEKWITKENKQIHPSLNLTAAEINAIRKSRLNAIAMKNAAALITEGEKPKTLTTAKNTTKNTCKSRNEIFLDTLISRDTGAKDKTLSTDSVPEKKTLSSFKIPRRNSAADMPQQMSLAIPSTSSDKQFLDPQPSTSSDILSYVAATVSTDIPVENQSHVSVLSDNILNSLKNNPSSTLVHTVSSNSSDIMSYAVASASTNIPVENQSHDAVLTDIILNSIKNKPSSTRVHAVSVAGVENEEPAKVKLVPYTNIPHQPRWDIIPLRGVIQKYDENYIKEKKTKKKVHFNYPGDDSNVVYVSREEFDISLGSLLRPVTKQVTKHERPPVKVAVRASYTDYEDELIFQICKWNIRWFQEKNTVKGEPAVFNGQIYHLKNEFLSYSDYRRGFYPLLLFQVWQVLAKEHDKVEKKNQLYNFEIKKITSSVVKNQFTFPQNRNEMKVLCSIDSQMVLERDPQCPPKPGDVVVLDGKLENSEGHNFVIRKLCIFSHNITKPISSHRYVSPNLRSQYPQATQVTDFVLKTRPCEYPFEKTEPVKFAVLKNLNPEFRMFRALDQLPASPLVEMICNPKKNNAPLCPVNLKEICKANVDLNNSQKKTILYVARSCLDDAPIIHLIHGPPGCGKSRVITGIFLQMWNDCYRTQSRHPQILLCAPSNAAVDELVSRLANIRYGMSKKKFSMVRVGRTFNKNVAMWTLESLVELELKKAREVIEDEELRNIETKTLEAKVNLLTNQLDNLGMKKNDTTYVNNLQMKLADYIKRLKNLTSGKLMKKLEGKELREKKKEIEQNILEQANVIITTLSTCFGPEMAHAYHKGKLRLTCCIVDEATQCTEPETLIPLMLGVTKLVLVGDPQQLPATVLSPTAKEHGLDRSLFARHQECWMNIMKEQPIMNPVFESRCHFLNIQYRMDPSIMQWPSDYFYKGRVKSSVGLELRKPNCPLFPYIVLSHDFTQSKDNESNEKEAQMLINIVRSIVRNGQCEGMDIGIITPYNSQKDVIKKGLSGEAFSRLVEVGTVDSYQGRERDIILFSCVRTEGIGFMSGIERLNVALTRAKFCLVICGNFVSLQKDATWAALLTNARNRRLIKSVTHNDLNQDVFHKICKPFS